VTEDNTAIVLSERDELLARAWLAYHELKPRRDTIFPPGVRKFHSIIDSKNDRDQRIINWFLSQQPKS